MLSWSLALALFLTGCPPCDAGRPELFHDNLEWACGDFPCGWERLEGGAEYVTTWHAGEHALELSDGGVVGRDLLVRVTEDDDGILFSVAVECVGDATIELRVEVDIGQDGPLYVCSGGGYSHVGGADGDGIIEPRTIPLTCDWQGATISASTSVTLERLEIELVDAGSCVFDDIRILSSNINTCEG